MASFGGLISGVLGRSAEGFGKVADMEMRKQGELDLKKQLLEVESEKRLREDESKRARDVLDRITEETRIRSPEYLAAQAKADADKFKALVEAGVPEAEAQAKVAQGTAAAKTRKDLASVNVEAGDAEFEANKVLEDKKSATAVASKILETKTLSEDDDYLENTKKIQRASKVVEREIATERANAIAGRGTGGTAKAPYMKSKQVDEKGNVLGIMSDGSVRNLGIKSGDYNKQVSRLVTDMGKDDGVFRRLPEEEKRKKAEARLLGSKGVTTSGAADAAGRAERASLDKFYN